MKLEVFAFDDYLLYQLSGNIGWEDSHVLDIELGKCREVGFLPVVLQFKDIRHLSSSTIGVLAGHARDSGSACPTYVVCNEPFVLELLTESGLTRLLPKVPFTDFEGLTLHTGLRHNPCAARNRCCYDTWQLQPHS